MSGVALHYGEEPLLLGRQTLAVLAANDRFMADVISHVAEIYRAPQRLAGGEQNAPVMIDWLAIIVATVASTMSGSSSTAGQNR
jgi:hypothetical protein